MEEEEKEESGSKGNIVLVTEGPAIPNPWGKRLVSAWSISLVGAIVTLVTLCTVWPDPYLDVLKFLPDGIGVTFEVTALAICCAVPLGLITGLGGVARNPVINLGNHPRHSASGTDFLHLLRPLQIPSGFQPDERRRGHQLLLRRLYG